MTCFDRNFPGHELITAILDAGGHVIARVKDGISLPLDGPDGGWLPDGSRLTWLNAPSGKKADRLPVRVAEHNAVLPAGGGTEEVSETCTVITTLLDHQAAPADQVRDAYLTRWSASETTFGEDKATIAGAGNRTSGPVLRSGSPRLVIQEAWAWLTATQLVRASEAAALRSEARRRPRAAPQGRRPGHRGRGILHRRPPPRDPLHGIRPGHRHPRHWTRSPPQPTAPPAPPCTPSTSPDGSGTPSARRKHARNSPMPPRPSRPSPGNPRSPCSHPASANPPPQPDRQEGGTAPPAGAADRGTARPDPPRHAGRAHARSPSGTVKTDSRTRTEHKRHYISERPKHLKYLVLRYGRQRVVVQLT